MSKDVILDTNILQYGVSKQLNEEVAKLFQKLADKKYGLAISAFTKFEIYRGLNKPKIPVTRELVDKITALEVDEYTFRIAAVLFSCYHNHTATQGKNKYDDDGDIVVGATAIRYNMPILTANGNDFPRPFFAEVEQFLVRRKDKAEIVVQLLQPSIKVFNETMHDCLL